ncbi:hypothetical protein Csa_019485 [Cucumis sativus]|nr:hypothetical protein Csa_019485 [Cucumis sativus]
MDFLYSSQEKNVISYSLKVVLNFWFGPFLYGQQFQPTQPSWLLKRILHYYNIEGKNLNSQTVWKNKK